MNDIPLHLLPSIKTPLGTLYLKLSRDDAEKRAMLLRIRLGKHTQALALARFALREAEAERPPKPKLVASLKAKVESRSRDLDQTAAEIERSGFLLFPHMP